MIDLGTIDLSLLGRGRLTHHEEWTARQAWENRMSTPREMGRDIMQAMSETQRRVARMPAASAVTVVGSAYMTVCAERLEGAIKAGDEPLLAALRASMRRQAALLTTLTNTHEPIQVLLRQADILAEPAPKKRR